MLTGNVAIILNLLSVALLSFAIVVGFLSILVSVVHSKLKFFALRYRKCLMWLLAASPWWVAATCVALFWPATRSFNTDPWFKDIAHWHHIDVFNLGSWHGLALLMAGGFMTWLAVSKTYRILTHSNIIQQLNTLGVEKRECSQDGKVLYILSSTVPAVFTTGLLSPRIYITTSLQKQVNQQELDIIVKHELAHVRVYDPLFKVLFLILCGFFPKTVSLLLMQQYTLLTEQIADCAVTRHHDNLDVAQTLVKVARLQRTPPFNFDSVQLSYFGNEQISQRVHELVSPLPKTPIIALFFALLLFISTPLFTASTVDSFHHLIESFFTH